MVLIGIESKRRALRPKHVVVLVNDDAHGLRLITDYKVLDHSVAVLIDFILRDNDSLSFVG